MKKFLVCLFFSCAVIANIYLIFYWQPQSKVVNEEEKSKQVVSYSKSLYKFGKENAIQELSPENKKEFEKIMKKLSAFDSGKIREYYEYSDEEQGILNIFKLLRKRLATEDYKKIEEISSVFLDIDTINEKIKEN